jgi:RimJ/RimL family protein N-acetyltransferase
LALLLGNGINHAARELDREWAPKAGSIEWKELLRLTLDELLADQELPKSNPIRRQAQRIKTLLSDGGEGRHELAISYPELFEMVRTCYRAGEFSSGTSQQPTFEQTITHLIQSTGPSSVHKRIVGWAKTNEVPILTTNYDECIEAVLGDARRFRRRTPKKWWRFSQWYPWQTYYSPALKEDPCDGFAIWHVHGDQLYSRSVRATVDQYMGMVERLRPNLADVAFSKLVGVNQENIERPLAKPPWLGILLGRKLWIQGLGLEPHEVVLRWLLLRRFFYWTKYRRAEAGASGWYVHSRSAGVMSKKTRTFLKCVGIETIELSSNRQAYLDLFAET